MSGLKWKVEVEQIARTSVWSPLIGGVHLRELSISGGLTVTE